jgi:dipeptidyl aminopeptidase/acylaminoacyl peptidase
MRTQDFHFFSGPGLKLAGRLYLPDAGCLVRYAETTPISAETAWHVLRHEPVEQVHKIRVPSLVFAAEDDTNVPCDQAVAFHDKLKVEKRLETFAVGNHWCVYEEQLSTVARVTKAWFDKHLGAQ